ncbi:hypothetical protein [Desulfovibrio sp. QI0442]
MKHIAGTYRIFYIYPSNSLMPALAGMKGAALVPEVGGNAVGVINAGTKERAYTWPYARSFIPEKYQQRVVRA